MSSFIALRKTLDLSSDANRHILVGRQNRDIPSSPSPTPDVPYDAEVEWLYAPNGAYIDTGIQYHCHKVQMKFKLDSSSDSDIFLFGLKSYNYTYIHVTPWSNRYSIGKLGAVADHQGPVLDDEIHEFSYDPSSGYWSLDGTNYTALPAYSSYQSFTGNNIMIGYRGGSASGFRRAYWIKIYDCETGALIRDLIPVRVGQNGCMYDKVSETLFENAGSGSFIYGPDVNVVTQNISSDQEEYTIITTLKKHYDFTITVSFDSNGGTACASQSYTLGSTYKDLPTPTKIQNVFLGWLAPNGQYVTSSSNVELSNVQLTAQWEHVSITGDYTSYLAVANSSYKNTGIYSATRYSSASAVYVDWGDGAVEKVDGNISKLAHTYSANGSYTVKVSNNITNFAPSYNDSTWYGTTSHARYTFKNITKVGSRLTSIPSYAFYYCSALSSIDWLSSFSSMSQIPSYCFYYCSGIPSLSALSSTSFRSTSTYAFQYCTSLKNLEGIERFTSFGSNTFYNCTGLSSIDQLSVTSIRSLPSYCFSYCSGLKNLNGAKLITSFGSYCFQNCTGLTGIVDMTDFAYTSLPNSYVFANCTNVKEFKLPSSFTGAYLGSYIFYYCSQLSSMDLPNTLTAIPSYGFCYCSNLRHIDIPSGVKVLNGSAFRYSGLSSINLPSTLTAIAGNYTFANCTSLKSIDIPDSVTSIANYSFYYDSALTSIDLPSSLTSLTAYVLQGCYNLGEITIPSSVTNIGTYALAGCYRLSVINSLRSVAPTVASTYTFGYSASTNQYSGYTGYSTRGSNKLNVPTGATGYSTGAWSSPLQNVSYCGFTLVEGGV